MGWLVFAIGLLWIVVAGWRAVVFVGDDMLESWRSGEEYDNALYGEAIREGLIQGAMWPIIAPMKALGSLLYRLAFQRADRTFQVEVATTAAEARATNAKPDMDITDELAKIPPEPITETRLQARLRRQAEEGRAEYQAKVADEAADE